MSKLGDEVRAIRDGAAVLARLDRKTLALTGPDRVRFLNGMVSNDVAQLAPGQGVFAVKTSNKGRVEAVVRVRATPDALMIDLSALVAEKIKKTLDQFIIMDDCAIADASREVVSIFGTHAREALAALDPGELPEHGFTTKNDVTIIRDTTLQLEGYELHCSNAAELIARLVASPAATLVSEEALEIARIEAGTPIDGRDLDEETFPMEARLERAISLTKGCYVGQEVIARATNFGGVKHILVGVLVDGGEAPLPGAELVAESGPTGELTSIAASPALGKIIALGYVRRSEEAPGTRLKVARDGELIGATVAALPFVK